ncbi:hypothetical protein HMPREF0880_03258 [Yokenella regensburgei ATCC 43003]|nr:hypothetical protein HMPREF0880_03258 [Yokenella regensburgei ATCC 43003]
MRCEQSRNYFSAMQILPFNYFFDVKRLNNSMELIGKFTGFLTKF